MNYSELVKNLYKKARGINIDKISLKIYCNLLKRGVSAEKVYEKMKFQKNENSLSKIKYFFEIYHDFELNEKEKLFFLKDYQKNGLFECLKNIKEYKRPENENEDGLEIPETSHIQKDNLNILYCSLIRDKEYFLEQWLDNIKSLKNLKPNWNIYLSCYENDSADNTKEVLKNLDYSFLSWVKITSEDTGKKILFYKERERVKNLAAYRNLCVSQYANLDNIDRIIMHDIDCMYDPQEAIYLIEESLNWDILSGISHPFNNEKVLYDSWVTRKNKAHEKWEHNTLIKSGINKVYSTGNGLVCYNPMPFKKGIGFGYIINDTVDSENVVVCENFRENGYDKIAFDTRCKINHIKEISCLQKIKERSIKEQNSESLLINLDYSKVDFFFNGSIFLRNNINYLIARYSKLCKNTYSFFNTIRLFELKDDFSLNKEIEINIKDEIPDEQYEDPRILEYNSEYYVSCANYIYRKNYLIHQKILVFDKSFNHIRNIHVEYDGNGKSTILNTKHQKNWTLFSFKDKLMMEYTMDPHVVLEIDPISGLVKKEYKTELKKTLKESWAFGELRMGSNPILKNGFYHGFFHSSIEWKSPKRRYLMGYYKFNPSPPFEIIEISKDPILYGNEKDERVLEGSPLVVFPCGAIEKDNEFIISFGFNDEKIGILKYYNMS